MMKLILGAFNKQFISYLWSFQNCEQEILHKYMKDVLDRLWVSSNTLKGRIWSYNIYNISKSYNVGQSFKWDLRLKTIFSFKLNKENDFYVFHITFYIVFLLLSKASHRAVIYWMDKTKIQLWQRLTKVTYTDINLKIFLEWFHWIRKTKLKN
jgi:hypothetical protein